KAPRPRTSGAPCSPARNESLQRLLVLELQPMVMDERLDALNELGDTLQRHQREADGKDELDRPADEAAGIRRGLVDAPGFHEPRPSEVDEDHADRQEKEQATDDIDPNARSFGE